MARRVVVICDGCGEPDRDCKTFDIVVGHQTDKAGSPDDLTERIDLCLWCLSDQLQELLRDLPLQARCKWLAAVRGVR